MRLAHPRPRGNVMTSHVKPIPDGYHTVTPVLMVNDAAKLIDFLKQAFGAREKERFTDPTGKIVHAEVTLGDSIVQFERRGRGTGSRSKGRCSYTWRTLTRPTDGPSKPVRPPSASP